MSIFDNKDFVNGFMEMFESEQFQKHMIPYLKEEIENARSQLEVCDEYRYLQGRVKCLKMILGQVALLKQRISSPIIGEDETRRNS